MTVPLFFPLCLFGRSLQQDCTCHSIPTAGPATTPSPAAWLQAVPGPRGWAGSVACVGGRWSCLGAVRRGSCRVGSVPGCGGVGDAGRALWRGQLEGSKRGGGVVACRQRLVGAAARGARGRAVAQPLAASLRPAALLHARPAPWGTAAASPPVPDHPAAADRSAAPSPSLTGPARAEPCDPRRPPPRGLALRELLSSPSWMRWLQQRGKGGGKFLLPAQAPEPGPQHAPAAGQAEVSPLTALPWLRLQHLAAVRRGGAAAPPDHFTLTKCLGKAASPPPPPPPPHVSPPKLQRKSRALGAKSYKTRGKRKIIPWCQECCKQGGGRARQTAWRREGKLNTSQLGSRRGNESKQAAG